MRKKKSQTKVLSVVASVLMTFSLVAPNVVSAETASKLHQSFRDSNSNSISAKDKLNSRLLESFKSDDKVTFLIKFKEKSDSLQVAREAKERAEKANLSSHNTKLIQRSAVVSELKSTSLESQQTVTEFLEQEVAKGNAKDVESYYIVNGMSVTATQEVAEKLATFQEVEKILPNETRQLFTTKTENAVVPKAETANIEWNVERVKAPEVWEMGIDGAGTVVASIDTGVQWDHPALKEKYRGFNKASGAVSHDFNWFDATAGRATPYDDQGHGTHVTGTMVGSEPNGANQIGVAPGAKYIAVKAFTASGGSDTDLLEAAEWILAPTDAAGNTRVDMAPDVVNNSWGGGAGLDEWYRDVVINWRAAEIFPEFSAGNTTLTNPGGAGSVAAPANYPESFATGATDINNAVANFSLRGPSPYAEIKPDVSAPGVNIRSSVPGGVYEGGWNGTSMAGPAVAGVAALLRQVDADITVNEMEEILLNTANPLTDSVYTAVPNHGYGYGLVDAYEAVGSIITGLGTLKGQVSKEGDDTEGPVFEHTAPAETYEGMALPLTISVTDNISVSSVNLNYKDGSGAWQSIEAGRTSGDYTDGEYTVVVPGEVITGETFTYKWTINDFGNNEVVSEEYGIQVNPGITVGYSQDFEATPVGWTSFGEKNSWEWGIPTVGPDGASSGEKVYATNLDGAYESSMNATLVMPPVDLPEGNSYLQFKQWHEFEQSSAGRAWDYGHVFISTDQVEWTQLLMIQGTSNGWIDAEVDLTDYAGQRVYIGFNAFSDGSVVKNGWYLDDVVLQDTSQTGKVSKGANKGNNGNKAGNSGNKANKDNNKETDKKSLKEAIDPKTIKPIVPTKIAPPVVETIVNPTLLPLGAQVSVLESGRSVYSNPADGTYSLMHGAGTFTAKAESYGFESEEKSVTIEADGTSTANFTLSEIEENTISGVITDQSTGEGIEGATIILVEDANVTPVVTDASGNYSLTAYEGDYTIKIIARGYHSQEVSITIGPDATTQNVALEPFYTYPGGEIGYDDGTAENARAFNAAGNAWAVKMSMPEGKENGIVTDGVFRFWDTAWPNPGGTAFAVEVWDATGVDGTPGKKLAGPIDATALRNGEWTVVDLTEHNITVNGDFFMVYVQTFANPNTPGLATDENGVNAGRSYQGVSGAWSPSPAEEGNYMIRARVSYEVVGPIITSPETGLVTNETQFTVQGTASPTTTIELTQNGEDAGSVIVDEAGKFSIETELTEGSNEFVAVSVLDGRVTGQSEPATVVLDTLKPVLTIDSPIDGEKTNRETVTVQGTIADENLDFVHVNGQAAAVSNGKYSKRILLDEGVNEILVEASDKAGNSEKKKVTVTADYNAPEITNLKPENDLYLATGRSVKIEFDSSPGLKPSFVIHMPLTNVGQVTNATELPMMEQGNGHYVGYWTVPADTVANGAVVEVKVVDEFANETRQKATGKLFVNVPAPAGQSQETETEVKKDEPVQDSKE
ncbi:bacillopeptidase F. Serine peptidase. MEROPS family S08A [Psychrobacillus psychrotolerans]|uniref:Bacillopeptidase F. Serine peptidase. MEROPS family S08A n=1 Tax=Psychrobacillus psychrotolerans TaxID=126156 RepID=A0A1I5XTP1_9BACI|nr:bacillopeptidase F. Serine peptidase. MEROPS family S08A [Psychrobacillus psychrotolerans]